MMEDASTKIKDSHQPKENTARLHLSSTEGEEMGEVDAAESRIYEIGYLLRPTIAAEEVPREVTAIKDLLEKEDAVVFAEEFPKLRQLSYGIRKKTSGGHQTIGSGYFGWMKFEGSSEAAKRVDAHLKQLGNLLRFILIKTVRENTLAPRPRPEIRRERKEAPKPVPIPASVPISEAELEKSLEKIIAD